MHQVMKQDRARLKQLEVKLESSFTVGQSNGLRDGGGDRRKEKSAVSHTDGDGRGGWPDRRTNRYVQRVNSSR